MKVRIPIMEAVVERAESPELRIVGVGDGGEAIRADVEPLESTRRRWGVEEHKNRC